MDQEIKNRVKQITEWLRATENLKKLDSNRLVDLIIELSDFFEKTLNFSNKFLFTKFNSQNFLEENYQKFKSSLYDIIIDSWQKAVDNNEWIQLGEVIKESINRFNKISEDLSSSPTILNVYFLGSISKKTLIQNTLIVICSN